jgi:hypothetical protein
MFGHEAGFKGDMVINLAEDISNKPSIEVVTWLLIIALTRFAVRNGKKKQSRKIEKCAV